MHARPPADHTPSLPRRLGWFVLLWLCGIAAVGLVALLIRSALL
ncbi:MAG: DUF2474 family protein [Hyphomicrobiaceae bacterium]